jgi:glutamyl-tRNA reductase
MRSLQHLAAEDIAVVDALTRQLMAKVLHTPTTRLRQAAATQTSTDVAEVARYLFALEDEAAAEHREDNTFTQREAE